MPELPDTLASAFDHDGSALVEVMSDPGLV